MPLALSIRVTIAALAALALAQVLQLPLPLWAVLTAVIVTQVSVGRSMKATFDYLMGDFWRRDLRRRHRRAHSAFE
jgi:uncharacterized membrane protein YgaE (UPF0421/DUF939 family)